VKADVPETQKRVAKKLEKQQVNPGLLFRGSFQSDIIVTIL